jgi:hypothetical protein
LFFYGAFWGVGNWRPNVRQVIIGTLTLVVVGWLMAGSEVTRISYGTRFPQDANEWLDRTSSLFGGSQTAALTFGMEQTDQISQVGFRVSARLAEVSAIDVISRTPEQIPFWGWQDDDWARLGTSWLPAFLFPDLVTGDSSGLLFLGRYGWIIDLRPGGTAAPATVLGDAWRRFDWQGVVLVHFVLAIVLCVLSGWLSRFVNRKELSTFGVSFGGGLFAVFAFSYTSDLINLFAVLPKRFLIVSIYAVIVTTICELMRSRSDKYQVPLHRMATRFWNG